MNTYKHVRIIKQKTTESISINYRNIKNIIKTIKKNKKLL